MDYKVIKITLIRHAKIDGAPAMYGAKSDPHCLKDDLNKVAKVFKEYTQCYCSPMIRCQETALQALGNSKRFINIDAIKEMNFGNFDGLPFSRYTKEDTKLLESINQNIDPLPGTNECYPIFKQRVLNFINDIITKSNDNDNYLVITHGGVIGCLIAQVLNLPIKDILMHMRAEYRGFTQFQIYINKIDNSTFWEISAFNSISEP
jgi:alpha-ribazole phosphatase